MNRLQDLELALNISFPMLYKDLYSNGMLDWGESGANWYEDILPILKMKPPLLLFAEDIEIWDPIDFRAAILEVNDREVYGIGSDFKMIPFAKNGAGDLFVFQFDLQQGDDVPVTFMPHDDCEAIVLAKNLQDFIFRLLLEAVREIDEDSMVFEEEEEDLKGNLIAQLHTHRPFLTAGQIGILEEIYDREIFVYSYKTPNGSTFECEGLATDLEVADILKREIGFEFLDRIFDYSGV